MPDTIVDFLDWKFQVDRDATAATYQGIPMGGSDSCGCEDCRNYVANRNSIFPKVVLELFDDLRIDFRKEVEITYFDNSDPQRCFIGGWFHFKGKILEGKVYRASTDSDGYTLDLTPVSEDFSIGFAEDNALTFFENNEELIQVEFTTRIPWTINQGSPR